MRLAQQTTRILRALVVMFALAVTVACSTTITPPEQDPVKVDRSDIEKPSQDVPRTTILPALPHQPLEVVKTIKPVYPKDAFLRKVDGRVRVRASVAPDGSVTDVVIVFSEPRGVFDKAAIQAMKQTWYEPHSESMELVERDYIFHVRESQSANPQ
jgi:TonB family protein